MYRVTKTDGTFVCLTENITWIKLQPNGCYGLCNEDEAQGLAANGNPYSIDGKIEGLDNVAIVPFDGAQAIGEHGVLLKGCEDALCELDAAYETRMSAVEDALCDLDSTANGGETNG